MAQAITKADEAKAAVGQMEGKNCEIEYWEDNGDGRHAFKFDGGAIHANKLDDEWTLVGFGSGWFAIRQN